MGRDRKAARDQGFSNPTELLIRGKFIQGWVPANEGTLSPKNSPPKAHQQIPAPGTHIPYPDLQLHMAL